MRAKNTTATKMGRPRGFDRDKALEIAMNLFWKHGYDGVTVSGLAAAMGINRPSLHAAFGGKEDLYRAVLKHYMDVPSSYARAAFAIPDTHAALISLLKGAAKNTTSVDTRRGCLMTLGATIGSIDSAEVREEAALVRKDAEEQIRLRLDEGKRNGHLPADAEIDVVASFVATVVFGMAIKAVGGASRKELERVAEFAMRAIRA